MSIWRTTALVLLFLAILVVYFPVLWWMWREWWLAPGTRYYGHGLLIIFISLFLILRGRSALRPSDGRRYGLPVLVLGFAIAAVGWSSGTAWISALSLPVIIVGVLGSFLGTLALRRMLFPVLFLAMAVPLPVMGVIGDWLKDYVGRAAIEIARAFGTQFTVDNTSYVYMETGPMLRSPRPVLTVLFPGGETYFIVALCSGLNFMLAWWAIMLPLLYITHTSWLRLSLFVLSVPPLGFVVKALMLAMVFVVTPIGGEGLADQLYHNWVGVPAFLGGLLLLVILLFRTRKKNDVPLWEGLLFEQLNTSTGKRLK